MKKNKMIVWLRKRMNVTALFFCAVGIALNLLLSAVAAALGLPLYLDTVGTITIALLGGYLPGSCGVCDECHKNHSGSGSDLLWGLKCVHRFFGSLSGRARLA